jgi:hypothetical protein
MKKILNYILPAILLMSAVSCDKGFEELNTNRVNPTSVDPAALLNNAIINLSYPTRSVIFDMGIVQQLVSPNGGVLAGANFNQDSRDQPGLWASYYQNVIKYTHDVIVQTKTVAGRSNLYNMARIIQAYTFMILTDEYGSIPYSEAGAGYTDLLLFPKYENQQDIYPKILLELTDATAALTTNSTVAIETQDVLYTGNITQWKKFGYSLLLRAGMRLSKVDVAKAQTTVQAAFTGGVIINNADNAYIRHDNNFTQPIGNMLNGSEAANFYLVKAFVDTLKSNNDPRLSAIAIRYKGATSGNGQTVAVGTTNPADQIGMPMGYDNGSIVGRATADGLASFYDYSQVDRRRMVKTSAPVFLVTAAQTNLLLAEAKFRGWITTATTADQFFSDGIRAHMDQMVTYDANSAVTGSARDLYVTLHPLLSGRELEQINTQYWIASFLNCPEAFANFRRSGFPALTSNPYGQPNNPDVPNGTFIRRLTYPTSELSVNTANVNTAIDAMKQLYPTNSGGDKLSTRVWWDKP